ncbi:MAG: gamma-glutamylcyclotransferase family protein [Paracoccus sp. (in: a-proteobacteria)]
MALYFAYGSNLLAARLRARCTSARRIGSAAAEGFDIAFDKIGQDGSGKATLVPVPGRKVPGALFQLDNSQMGMLDRIEGVGMAMSAAS